MFDVLGPTLKKVRESKGLSLAEVSRQTGYHVSSIKNMERSNGSVLWSRYTTYMKLLGLTYAFVPKDK